MDSKMKQAIYKLQPGERLETTQFNRATRRAKHRNRVRNNTWMTAHPKYKKTARNNYELGKLRGLAKNTAKRIINSMPKDNSLGWLRKIFS